MEHQPFNSWLVDRSGLNEDEEEILQDHLAACPECTALARDLQNLDDTLKSTPCHQPRAEFTQRFMTSLPERREREQARQVKKWMIGLFIALALNVILILVASLLTHTTSTWLVDLAVVYGTIFVLLQQISLIFETIVSIIPSFFWLPVILAVFSWGIIGLGLWFLSMRRVISAGVKNEN